MDRRRMYCVDCLYEGVGAVGMLVQNIRRLIVPNLLGYSTPRRLEFLVFLPSGPLRPKGSIGGEFGESFAKNLAEASNFSHSGYFGWQTDAELTTEFLEPAMAKLLQAGAGALLISDNAYFSALKPAGQRFADRRAREPASELN
jgi:hypothetical protein